MSARHTRMSLAIAFAAATLGIAIPATTAVAAEAEGCTGQVVTFSADGTELDRALGPGEGGTLSDPLVVDAEGVAEWGGSTNAVITDAQWSVTIMGLPFKSGSTDNSEGLSESQGSIEMSSMPAPAKLLLKGDVKIPVSGTFSGEAGTCTGSGYITGTGSPTSAPLFYAGIGFAAIGAALIVWTVAGTGVRGGA